MEKQFLIECLNNGLSTRDIESLECINISHNTINYYIKKYKLTDLMKYKKI